MVVISIIALLIAILLPSLKKARESAIGVTCQTHLRSFALATTMYAGDNNGKLIAWYIDSNVSAWYVYLAPYVGAADTSKWQTKTHQCPGWDAVVGYGWNYEWRRNQSDTATPHYSQPGKIDAIVGPAASRLLMGDTRNTVDPLVNGKHPNAINLVRWGVSGTWGTQYIPVYAAEAHLGNQNLLFLDGHIESQPADYLIDHVSPSYPTFIDPP